MSNRFPRWLAVANLLYALLGVAAAYGIYDDLTTSLIHDNSESVRIAPSALAIAVPGIGLVIAALLVASAIGGWRQRPWARGTTLGWIALVIAAQVFVIVQREGYGLAFDVVARAFPVVTVYAFVTLAALFAPSLTAATPASPRA